MTCFHKENIDLSNLEAFIQMHIYFSESFVRKFSKEQMWLARTRCSVELIEREGMLVHIFA